MAKKRSDKKARSRYVVYLDSSGEYRWRKTAGNGKIIATSGEGYTRRRKCLAAILKQDPEATIEDRTHDPKNP